MNTNMDVYIFPDLVKKLSARGLTLSCAESLTGGLLASSVVDVPGASKVFKGGFVTYCDEAKHSQLGVLKETLKKNGAISEETAREMAAGAAKALGTDIAIATTGNAGPDADEGKPVGLVYIGLYYQGNCQAFCHHFTGTRKEIRLQTVRAAARHCMIMLQ